MTIRVAILDDYQGVALRLADWSVLHGQAEVTVLTDHLDGEDELALCLAPFDVLCIMRERTALRGSLLRRLPRLALIASTGPVNAAIDVVVADELGIRVAHTEYSPTPTVEMTWALILAARRNLVQEVASLRSGGWQTAVGGELAGSTLGVLGLGRIGGAVARIGRAFGMDVVAWSQNLTPERAAESGAVAVTKEELFARSDVLTVHTLLSRRTRGLVDGAALATMKRSAWLVNTSRAAIVDGAALSEALRDRRIAGYAVDVFDEEPLPSDHPFRRLDNVLATPHLGYVAEGLYRTFYQGCVGNVVDWLSSGARRGVEPEKDGPTR